MSASAAGRLTRLLGLVPYLQENPGADLDATAEVFGISADELIDDLQLLFVTGRPGRMPDDLIEASWEDGRITVGNADEVSVPVRLTGDEATSLLVAFDYLASLRPEHSEAIASLRAKMSAAAGLEESAPTIDVRPPELDPARATTIREAIDAGAPLAIDYYVASRDELTSRIVTPLALRLAGQWYMDAWCHTSGGRRSFALGAIRTLDRASGEAADVGPVPSGGDEPAPAEGERTASEHPDAGVERVTLDLAPAAAWLADEIDVESAEHDVPVPGGVRIGLVVFSRPWLTRLLLENGRHVLAVRPAALAEDAIAEARRLADAVGPPAT